MRSPSLSSRTPHSGVRQHHARHHPAADGAAKRRFAPFPHRQDRSWGGPRQPGSVVRNGFFGTGVPGGHPRGRRTRKVCLADPVAPLAIPARLVAPLRASVASSRLATPLAPGERAARPGAVRLPALARPADDDLPTASPAVEQASGPAHLPSLERGGPGRQNAG